MTTRKTMQRVAISEPYPEHRWTWPARVLRVKDGDTLVIEHDRGKRLIEVDELRLAGIDAFALKKAGGAAALDFTEAWVKRGQANAIVAGTPWGFMIRTYKEDRPEEKYGRWLVVIWMDGDDVSLNKALLDAGHAVVPDYD